MSHFYGSMTGSAKTVATRCGTKSSGISAHTRGWDCGIATEAHYREDGKEIHTVAITGGSNATRPVRTLADIVYDSKSDTRIVRLYGSNGDCIEEYTF